MYFAYNGTQLIAEADTIDEIIQEAGVAASNFQAITYLEWSDGYGDYLANEDTLAAVNKAIAMNAPKSQGYHLERGGAA